MDHKERHPQDSAGEGLNRGIASFTCGPQETRSKGEGLYLFGIVENHSTPEGLPCKAPTVATWGELAGVAERVNLPEFRGELLKRNLASGEWLREWAQLHMAVLMKLMETGPVIPVKFGALFSSLESLRRVLKGRYKRFINTMALLRDKEEWEVKVYFMWQGSNPSEPQGKEAGTRYLMRKMGEAREVEEARSLALAMARDCFEALKPYSSLACYTPLGPPRAAPDGSRLVLSAAYLVSRGAVADFHDQVESLRAAGLSQSLRIGVSGPWPPFHFCSFY